MNTELRQEQERLDSIMAIITEQIGMLEDETSRRRKEVIDFCKHFWDDVKVNTDTFDDYLETIIALRQQAQNLSVSQSTHRQAFKRLSTLRRMQEVPYFGRIDFIEEGDSAAERIYIGISTLTDTSGENILIYDWRAPVSSVYYDYAPGPAEYATPGGTVRGTLEKNGNISSAAALSNRCSIRVSPLETRFYSRCLAKSQTNICTTSWPPFKGNKIGSSGTIAGGCSLCKDPLAAARHRPPCSGSLTCSTSIGIV
jgi:hypothetical protein